MPFVILTFSTNSVFEAGLRNRNIPTKQNKTKYLIEIVDQISQKEERQKLKLTQLAFWDNTKN